VKKRHRKKLVDKVDAIRRASVEGRVYKGPQLTWRERDYIARYLNEEA